MSSERDNMSDKNLESSCSMNLRSKRNSSKHDFACADASVSGEPAFRQPPELDERHPGKCNNDVEAGASAFHSISIHNLCYQVKVVLQREIRSALIIFSKV